VPICGTVSQISPPIRILLFASVGLIVAWMLFLKPSNGTAPAPAAPAASTPTAPGVKGLTTAIDKAKAAAAATEARDAKVQKATGGGDAVATAAAPEVQAAKQALKDRAAGKPAASAKNVHDLPLPVLKAIAANKVMALLFWNPKSADDRDVKRAFAHANRWSGQVFFHVAPIKSIADYGRITRGADVEQSPTIVVVDRTLKAERLVGYVDSQSIDQAVVDAMRNSGVLISDPYLRKINEQCATLGVEQASIVRPDGVGQVVPAVRADRRMVDRFVTRFKAIPAPGKWRAFKRSSLADVTAVAAALSARSAALGAHPSGALVASTARTYGSRQAKAAKSWNTRMDKQNVLSCGVMI
jgi:hypothetical protein